MSDEGLRKHKLLMNDLRQKLQPIAKEIGKIKVSYLDVPLHTNTGDQLIYQGTCKFLKENGITINTIGCAYGKPKKQKNTVIILHGGGNFGDLYKIHQKYREEIIKLNPDRKIIILPQTIYFESQKELDRSAAIFRKHKNIIIYARDEKSLMLAKKFTDKAYLSPDMAHWLYKEAINSHKKNNGLLKIRRQDIEKKQTDTDENEQTYDWTTMLPTVWIKIINLYIKVNRRLIIKSKLYFVEWIALKVWGLLSLLTIKFTMNFIDHYCVVNTDRLHGHILSSMMHKETYLTDNSYGKNHDYYKSWTFLSPLINKVELER